LPFKIKR